MSQKTYIFFGIVGAGKGTQLELLKKYLEEKEGAKSLYVYPGNEYRRHIKGETYLGKLVQQSMAEGNLQPDLITTSIITNLLIEGFSGSEIVYFDGYPRTVEQSKSLLTLINFFELSDVEIVYIELTKEEAMKRNLARGRFDDTPEGIEKRFNEYMDNVVPAMEYMQNTGGYSLHKINGEQSIEDVHLDIIKALNI